MRERHTGPYSIKIGSHKLRREGSGKPSGTDFCALSDGLTASTTISVSCRPRHTHSDAASNCALSTRSRVSSFPRRSKPVHTMYANAMRRWQFISNPAIAHPQPRLSRSTNFPSQRVVSIVMPSVPSCAKAELIQSSRTLFSKCASIVMDHSDSQC